MSNFQIDFFELMFLAEACIPPRPIARSMFWQNLSEVYFHKMTKSERIRAFEWLSKKDDFDLENEDCAHFYARFNPDNQYKVQYIYAGENKEIEVYKYNNRYHTNKRTSVVEEYISKVEKI